MAIKKDCFANKFGGYCSALVEMVCRNRECSFYKTREQFERDAERAKKRNENLTGVSKC